MTEQNSAEGRVKASLYISEENREKIRATGLTLEEYFNRILGKYTDFEMDRWSNGAMWKAFYRMAFVTSDTLNLILSKLDDKSQYQTGLEAGSQIRERSAVSSGMTPEELSPDSLIRHMNDYYGWGSIIKRGESVLVIMQPLFEKPYFLQGYLEGFLGIKLQIAEASHTRITCRIVK